MNPKTSEYKQAIALRETGLSYNEILRKVKVSRSTISSWLHDVPMSDRYRERIKEKQRHAQRLGTKAVRQKRIEKTIMIKTKAMEEIQHLTDRERWLIGVALYWAEGSKERDKGTLVIFSNSDPAMVLFFRSWAVDFLKVAHSDIAYEFYIHEKSENREKALQFWSEILGIDSSRLILRLKRHNLSPKRKNIGTNYKGLIRLIIRRSVDLTRKIRGWTNGIVFEDCLRSVGE